MSLPRTPRTINPKNSKFFRRKQLCNGLNFRALLFVLFFALAGCGRTALVLHQQKVTSAYLASTNVATPDPRTPPNGQMIVAEYWLPSKVRDLCPILRIHILFCDCTQTCVEFPIHSRVGYETYCVLNSEFKKTGGFLAYKAEIITGDGELYADWEHQLWVKLIDIEDDSDEMSSAVLEKSIQASVIETPFCKSQS